MAQRPVDVRQHRRRGVIAHRGDHLLAILGHRRQHLLDLLDRIAGGHLTAAQVIAGIGGFFRHVGQKLVEFDDLFDPFAKRLAGGQRVLHVRVVKERAGFHVDGDHLPRPQRALFAHVQFVHGNHPSFGSGNQQSVAGHHIPHRAQAVAVQPAADPAAIGHRQRGGAVPGLHDRIAIGIHVRPCPWQFHGGF